MNTNKIILKNVSRWHSDRRKALQQAADKRRLESGKPLLELADAWGAKLVKGKP